MNVRVAGLDRAECPRLRLPRRLPRAGLAGNPPSAFHHAHRYEPELTSTFHDLTPGFVIAVQPARVPPVKGAISTDPCVARSSSVSSKRIRTAHGTSFHAARCPRDVIYRLVGRTGR